MKEQDYSILKNAKIMIVDDVPDNVKLLGQHLKEHGVKISVCLNGQQAISSAKSIKPDLILMDINMPYMDGLTATEAILKDEETKHIPIIFLTALAEEEQILKGFEIGGVDYVTKPFNAKILIQRIKTHVTLKLQKDKILNQNKKLELADIEKNKFLSIVSHDLRSPFTGILGLMKILNDDYDALSEEDRKDFINSINESLTNQYEFLENLLSWGKLQFGKTQVDKSEFQLNMLLDKIYNVLKLNFETKKVDFVKNINLENIYADVNLFYSVIYNLITNALKFTPESGNITINAKSDEENYIISVKDSGIGMPDKVKNSLFKVGEVKSRPGTNDEPGTGLGLLLCQEIVNSHGGTIHVESEENKGSEFIIKLPLNK